MRLTKSSLLIFLLSLFVSFSVNAAGDGEATPGVAEDPKFQEVITKLNVLESSINAKRGEIKDLIKMKNSKKRIKNEEGEDITLNSLHTAYKELKTLEKDYEDLKKKAKYSFPAQGRLIERRYFPVGSKTLEELEVEFGLEGDLTRVKSKIVKKYKTFLPEEEIEKEAIKEKKNFVEKKEKSRLVLER